MTELKRFGVSMEDELLEKFDEFINGMKYTNRSEAIRDIVREYIAKQKIESGADSLVGTITYSFRHDQPGLSEKLTAIQHDVHEIISSTTHVHMDHLNCMEVLLVKGDRKKITELAYAIKSTKGVKYTSWAFIPL